MMDTGVYCWLNTLNDKVYIGSATQSLVQRMRDHRRALRGGYHFNRHLQAAWSAYGEATFVFRVLEICEPSDCLVREQHWLDNLKAFDRRYGYNGRPNAESNIGVKWCPEIRAKMAAAARRRLERPGERERLIKQGRDATADPEIRKRRSISRTGKGHTEETKARIGLAQRGRKRSPEAIAKTVAFNRGRKMSEEQKALLSRIKLGTKLSEETKARMSISQKKRMQAPEALEQLRAASRKRWEAYAKVLQESN